MLSLLEHIGAKSPTKKTRQTTITSAFSRVNARNESRDDCSTPSLTTGASQTDNSSEGNEDALKPEDGPSRRTSGRARVSAGSYNEAVLAGTYRSPQKGSRDGGSRAISGTTTLVETQSDPRELLLEHSVQALDKDWSIGAMPGDNIHLSHRVTPAMKRENSTRSSMIHRANTAVEKTKNVLGKRARETLESSKEHAAALYGLTSSRLRSRTANQTLSAPGSPPAKKPRISEVIVKAESPEPVVPKKLVKRFKKQYLTQGLYVGQDRNFNAKLTESQNKMQIQLSKSTGLNRKPLMPLPMFAGQRTIEQGRPFRLPFDIFSPLPPGQPKPDEWKKTQKNVFIGDAAAVWRHTEPLAVSTCICYEETGCDENCMNRIMFYECDDNLCTLGSQCGNRAFAGLKERQKAARGGKYNVGVEVVKTINRGYGIRANRCFQPNQIIVEYTGEIITQEECDDRMHGRYKDAECYYLMDFDQSMILDATRGSIARFVNHSCAPNCRMEKWTVANKPRIALFAGENGIMTGDELTYDYNFNPYSVKNVQQCHCGADNCRGVLGPRPKESKELKEALNPIVGAGKRKIQQVVEDAVDVVKNAAKRRKVNIPVSVKNVFSTSASVSKIKQPEEKKEKKNKKKPLPVGWVYVEDMKDEPPPPLIRNIFGQDPEALLRRQKRHVKAESEESSGPPTLRTTSGSTLNSGTPGRISWEKLKDEDEDDERPMSRRGSVRAKANSVRKNVVRTMKGRRGATPGTPGGKSIRVIEA